MDTLLILEALDRSLTLGVFMTQRVQDGLGHVADPQSLGGPAGAGKPQTRRCSSEPDRTSRSRRTMDASLTLGASADQQVLEMESLGRVADPPSLGEPAGAGEPWTCH